MGATPFTGSRRLAGELVKRQGDQPRARPAIIALAVVAVPLLAFALGARGVELIVPLVAALAVVVLVVRNLQPDELSKELAAHVITSKQAIEQTSTEGYEFHGQGEAKVAAILDGLGPSWYVIHDVALGGRVIDHVILGPAGAFTVQSDNRRGLVRPKSLDSALLARVYAEKGSVERVSGLFVQPLLVIGEAYLGKKPIVQIDGVVVMPTRELAGYLTRLCPVFEWEQTAELGEAFRLAFGADASTGQATPEQDVPAPNQTASAPDAPAAPAPAATAPAMMSAAPAAISAAPAAMSPAPTPAPVAPAPANAVPAPVAPAPVPVALAAVPPAPPVPAPVALAPVPSPHPAAPPVPAEPPAPRKIHA
jgi:hypothetical protein